MFLDFLLSVIASVFLTVGWNSWISNNPIEIVKFTSSDFCQIFSCEVQEKILSEHGLETLIFSTDQDKENIRGSSFIDIQKPLIVEVTIDNTGKINTIFIAQSLLNNGQLMNSFYHIPRGTINMFTSLEIVREKVGEFVYSELRHSKDYGNLDSGDFFDLGVYKLYSGTTEIGKNFTPKHKYAYILYVLNE